MRFPTAHREKMETEGRGQVSEITRKFTRCCQKICTTERIPEVYLRNNSSSVITDSDQS